MALFKKLVEDYAKVPVPPNMTVAGFRLGLILIGISIALPAFLQGVQIGSALGFLRSVYVFAAGGAFLAILGCFTGIVGARSGLTTYMLIQYAFGVSGAKLVNTILACTLLGWFGINAHLFGSASVNAIRDIYHFDLDINIAITVGGILMISTTIFGFKALDRLAIVAVPLLLLTLATVVWMSVTRTGWQELVATEGKGEMTLGYAISAVIGGYMAGVTLLPDLTRYLKDREQAIVASVVGLAIGFPLILMSAAIPSLATGESDLMMIIAGFGLGLPAIAVLVFSTWTTNVTNLYGAGLGLTVVFGNIQSWKMIAITGLLGTAVALAGIINHFLPFLVLLSIAIPPIAGIYVVHFYFLFKTCDSLSEAPIRKGVNIPAFVAWIVAIAVSSLSVTGIITLTTVPSFDSLIIAFVLYGLMYKHLRLDSVREQ